MLTVQPVWAEAPDRSPVPVPRPFATEVQKSARPDVAVFLFNAPGLAVSPRPTARPAETMRVATSNAATRPRLWIGGDDQICGNPDITGSRVAPIIGRLKGCGILNPVKVRAVNGVQLSRPVTVDCPTANALSEWVENGVIPVFGRQGGGVAVLNIAGGYSCRPRNNVAGAKLSEHGRGRAIDISGFRMSDGQTVTVEKGWKKRATRRKMVKLHTLACGPFGTVLGPNADRHHQDHFHLDTANHRSGNYCR